MGQQRGQRDMSLYYEFGGTVSVVKVINGGYKFVTNGGWALGNKTDELVKSFEVANLKEGMNRITRRFTKKFDESTGLYRLDEVDIKWIEQAEKI
jgi:hypothetical protein